MATKRAPGIYELEPGVFKIVISLGRGPDGRYRQKARVVRGSLRDAKVSRARLVTDLDDGKLVAHTVVTFEALLDRWLEHVESLGRSPNTVTTYRAAADAHLKPALGAKPVSRVTALDLDNLYVELGKSRRPSTVAKVHIAARGALTQGVRWGLVGRNVALDATPPSIPRVEMTAGTDAQLRTLVEHAEADFGCMMVVAATTGMRRGELCGLTWAALDLPERGAGTAMIRQVVIHGADGKVQVRPSTKTGRSRRIALDERTVRALKDHRHRCEKLLSQCGRVELGQFVFSPTVGNDQPYQPHTVTQRFSRLCERVGIEGLTFHQATRHFAATQLIAAGVDVRTVAGRLGHSRASITLDVYAHVVAERDQEAAQVLGRLFD